MNTDTFVVIGSAYGAVQAVAQFGMLLFPKHTIAWKVCKFLVSGQARPSEVP